MNVARCVIPALLLIVAGGASAQPDAVLELKREVDAQRQRVENDRAESTAKLREAITQLRQVRNASCQAGRDADCMLANLGGMELVLLEIEARYRRTGDHTRRQREQRDKLVTLTSALRQRVTSLADAIQDAETPATQPAN